MAKNEEIETRRIYERVFSSSEGQAVLLDILNELNFFSEDPKLINPERTAFANWLLGRIGINTVQNLPNRISAMLNTASAVNNKESEE